MKCKLYVQWNGMAILTAECSAVMAYSILKSLEGEFVNPVKAGYSYPTLEQIIAATSDDMFCGTGKDGTGRLDFTLTFAR